ncbi:MAG: hypothetical protein ACOC2L_05345, partial [Candidatus Sumerlaeota bacterium]
ATGTDGVQGGIPRDMKVVSEGGVKDSSGSHGGWYQTPWGLSEKSFLVSHCTTHRRSPNMPSYAFAIYYVDVWGNKELIARDPYMELAYPMVATPRKKPPVIPDMTKQEQNFALAYVNDVYADLPGIEKGEAKYLRISQRTEWINFKDNHGTFRWYPDCAAFRRPTFGYWSWSGTRVIGTVPVNPDGTAFFTMPVQAPLYLQLLDENMVEIRRERSHVEYQPGETRGCVGCHEMRANTDIPFGTMQKALKGEPDVP